MMISKITQDADRVIVSNNKVVASIDKAMASKVNKFYNVLILVMSFAILLLSLYCAVYVSASSAAVLGTMFVLIWALRHLALMAVSIYRNKVEAVSQELELEKAKLEIEKELTWNRLNKAD